MPTSVLIVCDVRLYREGLHYSLEQRSSLEVAGTAATPGEALDRARALCPEVVLLDMGVGGALELIAELAVSAPKLRVVALSVAEEPAAILECVEAGAAGYVARDASLDDLTESLKAAARGEVLCSPRIAGSLARRVADLAGERTSPPESSSLTEREREILALIDDGLSNKEIAGRLQVKVPTVKNHVHHILEKLGVSRRGAAAALVRGTHQPRTEWRRARGRFASQLQPPGV
jgi:DNA-binding NarL/FixJ family response regulator